MAGLGDGCAQGAGAVSGRARVPCAGRLTASAGLGGPGRVPSRPSALAPARRHRRRAALGGAVGCHPGPAAVLAPEAPAQQRVTGTAPQASRQRVPA